MRDRARIKPLLERLEAIWDKHPDLRLTQMIMCMGHDYSLLFNMEDNEFIEKLGRWLDIEEDKE
jgi:uncharacterized protein YihD (DUF1040 family)